MRLNEIKAVIASTVLVLVAISLLPFFRPFLPDRHEDFLSMAVLGEGKIADNYLVNQSVTVGDSVNWSIYVKNHRDEPAYVSVRVKLLDESVIGPESEACEPSPAMAVYEERVMLDEAGEWVCPFHWLIKESGENDTIIAINSREFKDLEISESVRYRLVFELWTFDEKTNRFVFGWVTDDLERQCVWNQVWFNIHYGG